MLHQHPCVVLCGPLLHGRGPFSALNLCCAGLPGVPKLPSHWLHCPCMLQGQRQEARWRREGGTQRPQQQEKESGVGAVSRLGAQGLQVNPLGFPCSLQIGQPYFMESINWLHSG